METLKNTTTWSDSAMILHLSAQEKQTEKTKLIREEKKGNRRWRKIVKIDPLMEVARMESARLSLFLMCVYQKSVWIISDHILNFLQYNNFQRE